MITPEQTIKNFCYAAVKELYGAEGIELSVSKTRKEFEGDYTLVTFALLKTSRKSPEATANELGEFILKTWGEVIESFNVIKGFLNLKFKPSYWSAVVQEIAADENFGYGEKTGRTVLVEYSSPNTNKPLHLGHVRNNLLGYSVARILEAAGNNVVKVNLVNDRGIHICKSMVAWRKFGEGQTPESSAMKGDHLVGKYYVEFDKAYKAEIKTLVEGGMAEDLAKKEAPIMKEASEMLLKWEQGDSEVVELWKMMNEWVYKGFDTTYKEMGVSFDKTYYESQTYLLGKKLVEDGLNREVFYRREDGSVWIDLREDGLDEKLLLRGDGTSVYMTQDLGTALERHGEYNFDDMTYVVGNEQNYHFDVLKLILKKLGYGWSDAIYHLSYGMVELPNGKMKSREGTVVDADDLMAAMVADARAMSAEMGKLSGLSEEESHAISRLIGLGALKYFILKVDPKKTMLFNPEESIDFNGNTAPFIQYTFARISSLSRRAVDQAIEPVFEGHELVAKEIEIVKLLSDFEQTLQGAASEHSPAMIAAYCYDLAKEYNQYYHDNPILKEGVELEAKRFRLALSIQVGVMLRKAMGLLGIELPERM